VQTEYKWMNGIKTIHAVKEEINITMEILKNNQFEINSFPNKNLT
jgi:hypothetical protein